MTGFGSYIYSIAALAILCAVVQRIRLNAPGAAMVRLMTTVLLICAIIKPLLANRITNIGSWVSDLSSDADALVAYGEQSAANALRESISEQCCTYIQNEAAQLNVSVRVSVQLSDGTWPQPVAVTVEGNLSPYAKQVLSDYITESLGIAKEAQTWLQ